MKKFIIAALAAVCAVCTALCIAACKKKDPVYYDLVYQRTAGVSFIPVAPEGHLNGAKIKQGTTVSFSLLLSDKYSWESGSPEVYANDVMLEDDGEGVFSFTMNGDTTVSAKGVQGYATVTFENGTDVNGADGRVYYFDEEGLPLTSLDVIKGETVKFRAQVSTYYRDGYDILANSIKLEPGSDGFYSFEVAGNTTVSPSQLELRECFTERRDGGSGTEDDPFRLREPIDLYQMAMLVNDEMYSDGTYYAGYYRLENDIDMQGEQLFIIGDGSCSTALFLGDFDGNSHKISNFHVESSYVNEGVTVYTTNVGMFGTTTASSDRAARIYNLTLENAMINADFSPADLDTANVNGFYVGALAGLSLGATVTGCSVTGNSEINVVGDDNIFCYVGGLIGSQQSAYSQEFNARYYSLINSCYTDIDVSVNGGYAFAAGGLVGYVASTEKDTNANIVNCYALGDVAGALRTGGLVGNLGDNAAIINGYASGTVVATSPLGESDNISEDLCYAYAGGITGFAGYDTAVYSCYFTGETYATAVEGAAYAVNSPDVAYKSKDGEPYPDSHASLVYNCYPAADASFTVNESFLRNSLKWDAEDWLFSGGMAVLNYDSTGKDFTVTVENVGLTVPADNQELEISGIYIPMSYWFVRNGGLKATRTVTGGTSYGYYLDEELNYRVPNSFVPTGDITLYMAFADYSEVAGVYALGDLSTPNAYITLNEDGTYEYVNGARFQNGNYVYDGETVIIISSGLAELSSGLDESLLQYYYSFYAEIDGGAIKIYGGYDSQSMTNIFPATAPLNGILKADVDFGRYYDVSNRDIYVFNPNGTGTHTRGTTVRNFTVRIDGTEFTIAFADGATADGTIVDGKFATLTQGGVTLKPYDAFSGKWESRATLADSYEFDGVNSFTHGESRGSYTIDESSGTLTGDSFTAKIEDGVLVVTTSEGYAEKYYAEGSFAGEWRHYHNSEWVNLSLYGITVGGDTVFGKARIEYPDNIAYDLNYQATGGNTITLYYNDVDYGTLVYNSQTNSLEGTVVSPVSGSGYTDVSLKLYDEFTGVWISEDDTFSIVSFNGNGAYDVAGDSERPVVRGYITVGGRRIVYKLQGRLMKGSFVYSNVTYNIEYIPSSESVKITSSDKDITLVRLDEWYNHPLKNDGGTNVYTFDGRGLLENGGKLTVSGSASGEYTYKIADDGSITLTDAAGGTGSIVPNTSNVLKPYKFTFNPAEGAQVTENLYRSNPYSGTWYAGKGMGAFEIAEFGYETTVSGTFNSQDVEFVYHVDGNYVTFLYDDNGTQRTLYINYVSTNDVCELVVCSENNVYGRDAVVCVPFTMRDEYYNVSYTTEDGKRLGFDGLGKSLSGNGTATLYDSHGNELRTYAYKVNADGDPEFTYRTILYIFKEVAEGESVEGDVYQRGGNKYVLVRTDEYYRDTVKDAEDDSVTYTFDGLGELTCSDGNKYSYTYGGRDTVTGLHYFTLRRVDNSGKVLRYYAVLNASSNDESKHTLKLYDMYYTLNVSDGTYTWMFDGEGTVIRIDGDRNEVNFTYVEISYDEEKGESVFVFTSPTGEQYDVKITATPDEENGTVDYAVTITARAAE